MNVSIETIQGDITASKAEAIVNAANNHFWMGSGVAGAIKRKGGQVIEDEAIKKGPVSVGQAVATTAGQLPYKYIIHAAGMGQDLRTDEKIVYETTVNTLLLADGLNLSSLAFPAIGTGVGGLSPQACARAMKKAIHDTDVKLRHLKTVHFVLFDDVTYGIFKKEMK
jgi:O-acetyl-ADP-ribose deacetylase (regulator of RNase III)